MLAVWTAPHLVFKHLDCSSRIEPRLRSNQLRSNRVRNDLLSSRISRLIALLPHCFADHKKTACYDIDVETDDSLKTQMNNFLLSTTSQQVGFIGEWGGEEREEEEVVVVVVSVMLLGVLGKA